MSNIMRKRETKKGRKVVRTRFKNLRKEIELNMYELKEK